MHSMASGEIKCQHLFELKFILMLCNESKQKVIHV